MINLLPPAYKQQQRFGRYNVVILRYLLLIIVVTSLLCSILLASSLIARRTSKHLNETIDQKQTLVADFEAVNTQARELNGKITHIANLINSQSSFNSFLGELEAAVPTTAKLKGLSLSHSEKSTPTDTSENMLQLTFDVLSQEEIAELQQSLEAMARVEFVDLQTLSRNDGAQDFSVIFVISLSQRPGEVLTESTEESS